MEKSLGCLAGVCVCVCVRKDLGCLDEITWHHVWQFGMVNVGLMCLLGSLGDLPLWGSAVSGVWLKSGGGVGLWACSPRELTGPWWAELSVWRREREGQNGCSGSGVQDGRGTPMAQWGNMAGGLCRKRGREVWAAEEKLRERGCASRWTGLRERSVCSSPQNSCCLSLCLLALPRWLIGFLKSSHCKHYSSPEQTGTPPPYLNFFSPEERKITNEIPLISTLLFLDGSKMTWRAIEIPCFSDFYPERKTLVSRLTCMVACFHLRDFL